MKKLIEQVTQCLRQISGVSILESLQPQSYGIRGKISVQQKNTTLDFDIWIPPNYPFTHPCTDNISIRFINKDLIGYNHINLDGSVCFHPPKDDDLERKLKSEIKGLKKWINDYYVYNKEDEHYTYLLHQSQSTKNTILYFGDSKQHFTKKEFGNFSYAHYYSKGQKVTVDYFFRLAIDCNKKLFERWSPALIESLNQQGRNYGLWCYIENEPIKDIPRKRIIVDNWKELQAYLPQKFLKCIYDILKEHKKYKCYLYNDELFVLLGYKIPTQEAYEVHWQLIKIQKNSNLFRAKKIAPKTYESVCLSKPINWGITKNISYNRFFGRGKLADKITEARILIIGVGALGSSLAEILTRGGVKSLCLDDFDSVEMGNLCRGNFSMFDVHEFKVTSIAHKLRAMSPYITVSQRNLKGNVIPIKRLEEVLNTSFDIIFDCSADVELACIFDKLDFKGTIFSLGLTNKAKYITCLTGDKLGLKNTCFFDYLESEPPTFFEGAGCAYPTFEASYNDVNMLLNIAVKKINQAFITNQTLESFVIKNLTENTTQIEISEFLLFVQPSLQQFLFIPKSILDSIKTRLLKHYPKEFGGIFIGYQSDKKDTLIVENVIYPEKYESSPTAFIRYPDSLNKELENIFHFPNSKTKYLGEFHSHPNSKAQPSDIDKAALEEIANNKSIHTSNPILMIAEIQHKTFKVNFFLYNGNKLHLYEQQ